MTESKIAFTYEGVKVEIPMFTFTGKIPGPRIFISGGMHGNEINGVHLVRKFKEWMIDNQIEDNIKGEIVVLPILNPYGFEQKTRKVPYDMKDLNRCFQYVEPMSISEYHAKVLMDEVFSKCDYGIDVHDSGSPLVLVPHTRVHKTSKGLNCSRDLGRLFGTEIILERDGVEGMLAVEMFQRYGKSILTVEIGGAGRVFEEYEGTFFQGVKNVLSHLDILKENILVPAKQYILMHRFGLHSESTSYIRLDVKLGESVKEGQVLGELYNPNTSEVIDIISPFSGLVFSRLEFNHTIGGKRFISVLETEKCEDGVCYLGDFIPMPKLKVSEIVL